MVKKLTIRSLPVLLIAAALVVASSLGGDAIVRTLVAALAIPIVLITLAGEIGKRTASPVS